MANMFDYIAWRGDLLFSVSPLNPVDFLIFSQISYLPFDGIVPEPGEKDAVNLSLALEILLDKIYTSEQGQGPLLYFKEDPDLINALLFSNRFKNCQLLGYVNKVDNQKEIQFSAVTINIDKNTSIIVYRGTDANFVGWKEDFNMAFKEVIPAQQEARDYLDSISKYIRGDLYIAGHSKGGNLAAYAASFCNPKVQKRIKAVYSFDAPGFHESIINSENYNRIKDKLNYYIPQGSVIGMVFEHGCDYNIVKSTQIGLLQHLLFSWEVNCNNLIETEKTSLSSKFVDKTIRGWINNLDNNQREQFVEGLYKILISTNIKSIHEMETSWLMALGKIVKSIGNIDESTRKLTIKAFTDLFRSAGRNLDTLFKRQKSE